MSYTELMAFDANGDALGCKEFKNAHYIIVIWFELAEKYGVIERVKQELVAKHPEYIGNERFLKSYARGHLMEDGQPIWDLQWNPDLTDEEWYVLMATFDNVVIPAELVEEVALAFQNFKVPEGVVDHGWGFAEEMRRAMEDIRGCRGIAFYGTSVNESPWQVKEPIECEDSECERKPLSPDKRECYDCDWLDYNFRPYNLDQDKKHWFLTTREAWLEQKEDKIAELREALKLLEKERDVAMVSSVRWKVESSSKFSSVQSGAFLLNTDANEETFDLL